MDDAVVALIQAADEGHVRDRRGHVLTPRAVQDLRWCLAGYVSQSLGAMRLAEVRTRDVKRLVGRLADAGVPPRRLRPLVESVQTLYTYAIERGLVEHNPALGIALQPHSAQCTRADVAIGRGLQLTTVGFAFAALILLVQAL